MTTAMKELMDAYTRYRPEAFHSASKTLILHHEGSYCTYYFQDAIDKGDIPMTVWLRLEEKRTSIREHCVRIGLMMLTDYMNDAPGPESEREIRKALGSRAPWIELIDLIKEYTESDIPLSQLIGMLVRRSREELCPANRRKMEIFEETYQRDRTGKELGLCLDCVKNSLSDSEIIACSFYHHEENDTPTGP